MSLQKCCLFPLELENVVSLTGEESNFVDSRAVLVGIIKDGTKASIIMSEN